MQINFVYDSSVGTAPAGFATALNAAAQFLDTLILNPITVNIQVGFGEEGGTSLGYSLGEGGPDFNFTSYAPLRAELIANAATPIDQAAVATLSATDPTYGASFLESFAEEKAWGLLPADGTEIDGSVGFSAIAAFNYSTTDRAVPGEVDFVGVAEHELTHALGRLSGLEFAPVQFTALDLFRYQVPGYMAQSGSAAAYFSINDGTTDLGNFDTTSDYADWASSNGPDSFDAYSQAGVQNPITQVDAAELSVLGFDVACFGPATRIRTLRGEIQVESLRPGEDQAITAAGTAVPIVWIGQRHLDLARHPLPQDVMPVRVRRGAIAPGQPARDLLLSPDHALALGGVLIPVRYLVNGRTIRQEPARAITYWHVELARHDVLLAEGLPCESYLDTGNRAAFANARPALALHPDFARPAAAPHACAPLVLSGPRRTEARRALLARAEAIGHRLTANPALRVLIDGAPARATLTDGRCTIQLPPAARRLRLLSRSWVPAHTHAEDDDMRRLGIAVTRLRLDDRPLALDDPRLSSGWQKPEGGLRWTDGDAGMALAGGRRLVFEVAMHGTYWATDDPVRWPIFACAQ